MTGYNLWNWPVMVLGSQEGAPPSASVAEGSSGGMSEGPHLAWAGGGVPVVAAATGCGWAFFIRDGCSVRRRAEHGRRSLC